jgi:hypothetical protein
VPNEATQARVVLQSDRVGRPSGFLANPANGKAKPKATALPLAVEVDESHKNGTPKPMGTPHSGAFANEKLALVLYLSSNLTPILSYKLEAAKDLLPVWSSCG